MPQSARTRCASTTVAIPSLKHRLRTGARNERKAEIVALPKGVPQTILELHLNPNQPHRNPDGELIVGSHWHVYCETYGRRWAYPAVDVESDDFVAGTLAFFRKFQLIRHPEIVPA